MTQPYNGTTDRSLRYIKYTKQIVVNYGHIFMNQRVNDFIICVYMYIYTCMYVYTHMYMEKSGIIDTKH